MQEAKKIADMKRREKMEEKLARYSHKGMFSQCELLMCDSVVYM